MKLIEMTRYGNIASTYLIKQQQNLRELTVILKKLTVVKILSSNITCSRETVHERKSVDQFGKFYHCLIFKKLPQPPQTFSNQPDQSAIINTEAGIFHQKKKKIKIAQGSLTISIFLSNKIF